MTAAAAERVRQAMRRTPRAEFLLADQRPHAHHDRAMPIGHDVTCSQPSTVAAMLELLDVRPGHRVLDVGSGSGWTTALLSDLAGPDGHVLGVEREPDLVVRSTQTLHRLGVRARVETATPGVVGRPADGPYDRILVSAEASTTSTSGPWPPGAWAEIDAITPPSRRMSW